MRWRCMAAPCVTSRTEPAMRPAPVEAPVARRTGWNIKWVGVAGGSGGGTELANYGAWAVSDPLTKDLKTTTARRHVRPQPDARQGVLHVRRGTRNLLFRVAAGPGRRGGGLPLFRRGRGGSSAGRLLQSGRLVCYYLSLGPGPNEGGSTKWSNHHVSFRDDGKALQPLHPTQQGRRGVAVARRHANAGSVAARQSDRRRTGGGTSPVPGVRA
jgi:hypothetical protein